MQNYTNETVYKLVEYYIDKGGELIILNEAVLACYGKAILTCKGLKSVVIKEVYVNTWSSGNSIRFYNKLPQKYKLLTRK